MKNKFEAWNQFNNLDMSTFIIIMLFEKGFKNNYIYEKAKRNESYSSIRLVRVFYLMISIWNEVHSATIM